MTGTTITDAQLPWHITALAMGKTSLTLVTCWLLDAIVPGAPLRYLVFAEKRRGGDCEITRPGYRPARHH